MGDIVSGLYDGSSDSVSKIDASLNRYTGLIDGWANSVATKMAEDVDRLDSNGWKARSVQMSTELQNIVKNTPVGHVTQNIISEQVKYIKSLPIEAAGRVYDIHAKAIQAMSAGERPGDFTEEIMRSGDVAESRARLIARTEIGRASTALTQARSLAIGSDGYIWRTADDGDVRHSHQKMEGKFVRWDSPPTLREPGQSTGMTGHAGSLPNCRCYPEVTFPKV